MTGHFVGLIFAAALCVGEAMSAEGTAAETCAHPVSRNVKGHENIEWSIAYAYGVVREAHLPRVLLIGDSILAQHEDLVRKELDGRMTVSYWASSYCLAHPSYLKLLDFYLRENDFAVIHFNNGLHSLRTPTEEWTKALREALALIRRRCPKAKIVWRTSTPLNDPAKAPRVRELNAAAAEVVAGQDGIAVDDLFAAMDPLDRAANWSDPFHFNAEARKIQAKQVAASCLTAAGLK